MSVKREIIEARVREINDAVQTLEDLTSKDFTKLSLY
jgi:hypothetical protein